MTREISIGNIRIGGDNPIVLIAGPCSIESESSAMRHAKALKDITGRLGISFVYKASYDKANRTSIDSFRGPGLKKGLKILKSIKDKLGLPVLSDVHCRGDVKEAARVLDIIQIPAFLSRQTDLIVAAAKTGKVVNIKKGQFLAPWDMRHVVKKIESAGNKNIILTERGASFGYNNLVSDFRSILVMKDLRYPVVYDATHSVQTPGGLDDKSGGEKRFIPYLSMAAAACGVNGIFVEVHENPDKALSDGPNMIKLDELEAMLIKIKRVERACQTSGR
ncbi:MAG: 3-deoxy-8-phosphooctulonate synthase [Candidatus Omnitrophota bacterium]|nr:3-deoxy-8-phosphooctulonate synthase [Candidatus Omnitrophota bacterium]